MAVVHFLLEKTEQDFERECYQLSEDYSVRKQEIEALLNEAEDHRNLILTHLTILADSGVKLLKSAERYSRIPADLGRFEQRPFLRLKFKEPTSEARRVKLAELLDEFIAAKITPSGSDLLQRKSEYYGMTYRNTMYHLGCGTITNCILRSLMICTRMSCYPYTKECSRAKSD